LRVIPWHVLKLREKHENPSVRVAARILKADTVQYKKINSTIHRRKTVTQCITMSQNIKEHRTHNREQEDKPNLDFDRVYARGLQVNVTVTIPTWVRENPLLNLSQNTGYYNFSWLS
jgi:hypothetical protein